MNRESAPTGNLRAAPARLASGSLVLWLWVGATSLGGPISFFLPQLALALSDGSGWSRVGFWSVAGAVGGLLAGGVVGFGQARSLRQVSPLAHRWIAGTVAGWALGGAVQMGGLRVLYSELIAQPQSHLSWAFDVLWVALGVGIGLGQWLVLRSFVGHAGWWIVVTAVGWGVGGFLGSWLLEAIPGASGNPVSVWVILGPIASGIPGLLTGVVLKRWLR